MKAHTITGGGGIQLHVEETGNRRGRPILFIHGFSQCRLAWRKQMQSDLAKEFRLIAMDIRGHGLSAMPRDAYGDSKLWADDVHAVIQTLRLDRPVLSGWSYGGVIICDYVRVYGDGALGGINLVGAVTKLGTDAAFAVISKEFLGIAPGFFSNDVGESVKSLTAFMRMCAHKTPAAEDFYFFLGYNTIVPPYVREGLFSRKLENDDLLPKLTTPVLITHGAKDAIVLPEAARQHARAISHAKLSLYPNAGHAPFWEDAARFNRELRAFAKQTGARATRRSG
jgi:pimeloyl-ACP methyl ester carboxylesterase